MGYLLISDPARQTIDELAGVLRASRSAIAGAVTNLQSLGVIRRGRAAGQRVDRVWAAPIEESKGFDPVPHREMAAMAREGLLLLSDSEPERHQQLEEMVSLGDFLADRLPDLLAEWRAQRRTAQMASGQAR
jgi:hypothetical protein